MRPWWSWRPGQAGGDETGARGPASHEAASGAPPARKAGRQTLSRSAGAKGGVHLGQPSGRGEQVRVPKDASSLERLATGVAPVTLCRVGDALELLDVRYLADGDGSLLAMWERHAVLFTLEGPDDEILVIRARPHATVPPDWADRAYRVVNEWNHTRRFCKAYVGDPTERGQLPIYAELQVPLSAGAQDALLVELLDCGAAVATSFVDWLHDEGALL